MLQNAIYPWFELTWSERCFGKRDYRSAGMRSKFEAKLKSILVGKTDLKALSRDDLIALALTLE